MEANLGIGLGNAKGDNKMRIARKFRNHKRVSKSRLYDTRQRPLKGELLSVPETQGAIWMNHLILPSVSVVSHQAAIYFVSGNSLVNNTKIKITFRLLHYALPAP